MNRFSQIAKQQSGTVKPKTLVEILGQSRVLVEHHKGILCYGTEEITIGATFGMLSVLGEDLRVCCMSRDQLFIAGRIESVRLEGRE